MKKYSGNKTLRGGLVLYILSAPSTGKRNLHITIKLDHPLYGFKRDLDGVGGGRDLRDVMVGRSREIES